MALSGMALV